MFNYYYRFFGITELNSSAKRLVNIALSAIFLSTIIYMFTSTFYTLYALQFLTPAELGMVRAVQFLIQGITDYPTGAVGDWIGQKWLLVFSNLLFGTCYILLSFADNFFSFLIVYAILGFAQGQNSGAFMAWFDNNYKLLAPEDDQRKIYMDVFAKSQMINQFLAALVFVLGGMTAIIFGRSAVFFVQGFAALIVFVPLFLLFINDHPDIKRSKPELRSYINLLGEGVAVTWKNKTLRYTTLAFVVGGSMITFWANILLFPFYESYAKTDNMTGLLRAVIYLIGAISVGILGTFVRKQKNPQKLLAISAIFGHSVFFWGILFLAIFIPPGAGFLIVPYLAVIMVFSFTGLGSTIFNILYQRFNMEIVPDKNRNSVYSLVPTLFVFANIISTSAGGYILSIAGFNFTVMLISMVLLVAGIVMARAVLAHNPEAEKKEGGILLDESASISEISDEGPVIGGSG
ncbi:MAG: MFS transporter [Candidatus Odinarchaeota archaeon]